MASSAFKNALDQVHRQALLMLSMFSVNSAGFGSPYHPKALLPSWMASLVQKKNKKTTHLPRVVWKANTSWEKNSSHAHWWLRFGVQSSAPLIGSDCTFLRLPPWGIWMSWKPSSPVKVIFPSQSESCGRLSARFEAGWSSFHCHLLLAWGTVLLEIEPGKNPGPLRCALVCLDHPMILVSLFIHRKKKTNYHH